MLDSTLQPLDGTLNDAVLTVTRQLVPIFYVDDATAPSTYRQLCRHMDAGHVLVVADEGSDHTIFGDPSVNHAFRAWHDYTHWRYGYDFSVQGEMHNCNAQIEHLLHFYGPTEDVFRWAEFLVAEVIGQLLYYKKYGEYIADQRAFVQAYIEDAADALAHKW